jgi:hypothetical protein
MTFNITSDSPYLVPHDTETETAGSGEPISLRVNPLPQVSISGGNARLLNA